MKVILLSHTPNPEEVCDIAAHTCVASKAPLDASEGCKSLKRALKSGHESVAEHATFTFMIEGISRACSHQLVRHRMASYAQQSQRYVKMDDFEYVTPKMFTENDSLSVEYDSLMDYLKATYSDFIKRGIPEEDARYVLPNACCTNITVTMNAREIRHFLNLRLCNRAQWEIREVAHAMLKIMKQVAPMLVEGVGPNCTQPCGCQESKPCGEKYHA